MHDLPFEGGKLFSSISVGARSGISQVKALYTWLIASVGFCFCGLFVFCANIGLGQTCSTCPDRCLSQPALACNNGDALACDINTCSWYCAANSSPIIVDVSGHGFSLTSAQNGVDFDFFGTGKKVRISWTDRQSDNAWLVLDRNHNGVIDNATEMFGNITPQPQSPSPNGFLALAVFDQPKNGGNGDGVIDNRDAIYPHLRLWIDKNHNGISEPGELFTLQQLDVESISLDYKLSELVDEFGNRFRYRSTLQGTAHSSIDRTIYDVFLVMRVKPAT